MLTEYGYPRLHWCEATLETDTHVNERRPVAEDRPHKLGIKSEDRGSSASPPVLKCLGQGLMTERQWN